MASCDIQVVNPAVLSRIESFLNDPSYREIIENSCNYNTRLCIERRLRLPFLDSQTGVAQNHSSLWMRPRERIPGLFDGQVYTYPSKRWRKKRRQYLMQSSNAALVREVPAAGPLEDLHTISTVENPAAANSTAPPSDDSKDSSAHKDDVSIKALSQESWYYDDFELQAMEAGLDEDGGDSDYDYEESYSKRRKKRGAPGKPARGAGAAASTAHHESPHTKKATKGTGQGRGRKKGILYDATDTEKPFGCDRDKNRSSMINRTPAAPASVGQDDLPPMTGPSAEKKSSPEEQVMNVEEDTEGKDRAAPSLYCDFCLGDQQANKKSGRPEPLVSCSDCGRSGHPTCLQFTDNMIISIRKYRWQCIECKCCSLCGTSDNDDQLLFCDDCDRGYHMYCLVPPLTTPPEGSWSCQLCLIEFHSK